VSPTAIALILVAAIAHASWNLFSKQASVTGAVSFIWLMSAAGTALYAPVIVIAVIVARPHLTALSWVFMAGTGVLQAAYFLFLQSGYRLGDLSLVYPIGRGTGALLAALAGIVILGERPGTVAIAGIACIVTGIVVIGIPARSGGAGPAAAGSGPATPKYTTPSASTPSRILTPSGACAGGMKASSAPSGPERTIACPSCTTSTLVPGSAQAARSQSASPRWIAARSTSPRDSARPLSSPALGPACRASAGRPGPALTATPSARRRPPRTRPRGKRPSPRP